MDTDILYDFFADEVTNRQAADENVRPSQILSHGDFFLREYHGFRIYGEVLDVGGVLLNGQQLSSLSEEEREEYDDGVAQYAQPHMRFYRFTKCYSVACPRGEMGDVHLSTVVQKLTTEEFLTAKAKGWR